MALSRETVDRDSNRLSADSFDRFGDDLSELILSYLPTEDKFRFECLSEQFQRVVFNKITELSDNSTDGIKEAFNKSNINSLIALVDKCPNVKYFSVKCRLSDAILSAMIECWPRLESIAFNIRDISVDAIIRFGQNSGHRLKSIEFFDEYAIRKSETDYIRSKQRLLLSMTPMLNSLKTRINVDLTDSRLVPNLKSLPRITVEVSSNEYPNAFNAEKLEDLVDKYEDKLMSLDIEFKADYYYPMIANINALPALRLLTRFSKLEEIKLKISYRLDLTDEQFNEFMTQLADKCPKVKIISLTMTSLFSIDFNVTFGAFKSLEEIKFEVENTCFYASDVKVEPLIRLTKTSIFLNDYSENYNMIVEQLIILAPNLKSLEIRKNHIGIDSLYLKLSNFKLLEHLVLKFENLMLTDGMLYDILNICLKLKRLSITCDSTASKPIEEFAEKFNRRCKEMIFPMASVFPRRVKIVIYEQEYDVNVPIRMIFSNTMRGSLVNRSMKVESYPVHPSEY